MTKSLKVVFFGTPDFAVPSLRAIYDSHHQIVAVVTAPDKPAGRGLKISKSAMKVESERLQLPILQPEKLKSPNFIEQLKSLSPDVFVVVAFRYLPESIWTIPPKGTFNLHASLLPKYRGAAPIHHAIINGETETGVTTFLLDKTIDTGAILLQEKIPIGIDDTTGSMYDKLSKLGSQLVVKTLNLLSEDAIRPIPQRETDGLPIAPKIYPEFCEIKWNNTGKQVYDFVRGLNPQPGAYIWIKNPQGNLLKLKIFLGKYIIENHTHKPGACIFGESGIKFAVLDGYFQPTEVQLEGKRKMSIDEFLRGYKPIVEYHANT